MYDGAQHPAQDACATRHTAQSQWQQKDSGSQSMKGQGICNMRLVLGHGSPNLQVLPDDEGLHGAHLQALQRVGHPKHIFPSVLADLIKEPARSKRFSGGQQSIMAPKRSLEGLLCHVPESPQQLSRFLRDGLAGQGSRNMLDNGCNRNQTGLSAPSQTSSHSTCKHTMMVFQLGMSLPDGWGAL